VAEWEWIALLSGITALALQLAIIQPTTEQRSGHQTLNMIEIIPKRPNK